MAEHAHGAGVRDDPGCTPDFRRHRWDRRDQRGQTLVEFALAIPALAMVFFGIFEYGIVLDNQLQLRNAARDAGRAGAIRFETSPSPIPDSDRVTTATSTATASGETSLISCSPMSSSVLVQSTANPPILTVTLSCPYHPITPLGSLATLLGHTVNLSTTLSSTTTRYIEP